MVCASLYIHAHTYRYVQSCRRGKASQDPVHVSTFCCEKICRQFTTFRLNSHLMQSQRLQRRSSQLRADVGRSAGTGGFRGQSHVGHQASYPDLGNRSLPGRRPRLHMWSHSYHARTRQHFCKSQPCSARTATGADQPSVAVPTRNSKARLQSTVIARTLQHDTSTSQSVGRPAMAAVVRAESSTIMAPGMAPWEGGTVPARAHPSHCSRVQASEQTLKMMLMSRGPPMESRYCQAM